MEKRLKSLYSQHSGWETPFRVVFGMTLCFGIASLAPAINDVLRGLRLIAEGLLLIPGSVLSLLRRPEPAREDAPEMPSYTPPRAACGSCGSGSSTRRCGGCGTG